MNPSFVIVLITPQRWSPGFPGNNHSLPLKVVLLPCSDSTCEHIWSIEDWIHSKRRNILGQDLVEGLVNSHTNLKLEQSLEMYESGLFPWDIEKTVEESLLHDEDGVPHSVSDFESESESEKDSD